MKTTPKGNIPCTVQIADQLYKHNSYIYKRNLSRDYNAPLGDRLMQACSLRWKVCWFSLRCVDSVREKNSLPLRWRWSEQAQVSFPLGLWAISRAFVSDVFLAQALLQWQTELKASLSECFMEGFMTLNIINFDDMTRRENDRVS